MSPHRHLFANDDELLNFYCRRAGTAFLWQSGRRAFPLPGDQPHYARDRAFDVKHLKLELHLDLEQKRLQGTASITLTPINDGLEQVELDAVELSIDSVSESPGHALKFETSDRKVRIALASPVLAGRELTILVAYQAHNPRRGLYFIGPEPAYPDKPLQVWSQGEDEDNRYWFPCFDFPNDRLTSEVVVTVPSRYFALSNGRLQDTRENAEQGTKTYHWVQDKPHPTYLISLVAGEFVELKDRVDGVPLSYLVPPGRGEDARRSFSDTAKMISYFSEKIGVKYPWDKYAQITVADFIFGGMENTSCTTLTDTTLHDARAHLDLSSNGLVAHELAHQWFGDLLTCRDWSHAWLNEGFATYFEALFEEHHKGVDEFRKNLYDKAQSYLQEDGDRYRRPIVTNTYSRPIDLFDRHLYEKGSLVLNMLRFVLGDQLFWKAINLYCRKHMYSNVITQDLQRSIEEATGKNLDWFFDEWVYKGGHPDFKVLYNWDEERKLATLTVNQTQKADELTPVFRMPVDIAFLTDQGRQVFRVTVSEKQQSFHFPLDSKPKMVRFDPGNWILKTLDFELPKELLTYQLSHDEEAIGRMEACRGLAKLGSLEAVAALKDALLHDSFWSVQAEAASALGKARSESAFKALLEALDLPHPKARRAVVRALGEFKDEAAVDALLKKLEHDESYLVEAEAARSLGKTKSSRAFPALQGALGRDSYLDVLRTASFEAMAELREEQAIPLALEWAKYGKPPVARIGAVAALGRLGEIKGRYQSQVLDTLIDLADDPQFRMRLAVINALETLRDTRAIPALSRLSAKDLDGRVVRRCREAIASLREGQERSEELRKLRDDLDQVQEENRKLKERLEALETKLQAKS